MDSLVSIVVPAFRNRNDIEKCIRSCLEQEYAPVEVIAVDDGSTDGTGEVLDRMAAGNPSLRVIHQGNSGVCAARDRGAAEAKGEYLTFVDADDRIAPDYIGNFVRDAERTGADLCICGYTMVYPSDGSFRDSVSPKEKVLPPWEYRRDEDESYAYHLMATWARFYRMSFWREKKVRFCPAGITDRMTRGEDIPVGLFTNYFARKVVITDQTGYYYRQNPSSARHHMRGLREYSLPFREISDCVEKVWRDTQRSGHNSDENQSLRDSNESRSLKGANENKSAKGADPAPGCRNHWYFFEMGVLRVFSLIQFDLLRGAERDTREMVYRWEAELMKRYFPDIGKNPYVKINTRIAVPFYQKTAVCVYRCLFRLYIDQFYGKEGNP